jgi:ACT domain-containing protein
VNLSTQRVIKNKLGVLNLARELNNIAKACRMMGVSRDTFYRYLIRFKNPYIIVYII